MKANGIWILWPRKIDFAPGYFGQEKKNLTLAKKKKISLWLLWMRKIVSYFNQEKKDSYLDTSFSEKRFLPRYFVLGKIVSTLTKKKRFLPDHFDQEKKISLWLLWMRKIVSYFG